MPVEIIIDSREKADTKTFFLTEIKKKYNNVRIESLQYGDFEVRQLPADKGISLIVERKGVRDLMNSINNHRLVHQVANLIHNCKSIKKSPTLIAELDPGEYSYMVEQWKLDEALNTLNYMIPVIRVGSMKHTAKELIRLAQRIDTGNLQTLRVTPMIIRADTEWEQMLCSIKGVSVDKAKTISKTYPNLYTLFGKILTTYPYHKSDHGTKKAWNKKRWFAGMAGIGPGLGERVERLFSGDNND